MSKYVFLIWNLLMIFWLGSYWVDISGLVTDSNAYTSAGATIGAAIGTIMVLFIWLFGSVIIYMFKKMFSIELIK